MFSLEKNVLLIFDILNLLLLKKQVLVDTLHGVHLAHLAVRDEEDFAEAALVDHLADLEVLQVHLLAPQARLANPARAAALLLLLTFLGYPLVGIVLCHVRLLKHNEVIE